MPKRLDRILQVLFTQVHHLQRNLPEGMRFMAFPIHLQRYYAASIYLTVVPGAQYQVARY